MQHQLFLLRHAKSDWSTRCHDQLRPLSDRGRRDANRMGNWLREQAIKPARIISSPAERCIQTCHYLLNGLQTNDIKPEIDERLYLASADVIQQLVTGQPENRENVLLIAHNPGLDEFLSAHFTAPLPITEKGKLMSTASMAIISLNGEWSHFNENNLILDDLVRPKDLSAAI